MKVILALGALVGVLSLFLVDLFLLMLNGFVPGQLGRVYIMPIPVIVIALLATSALFVLTLRTETRPLGQSKVYLKLWLVASAFCLLLGGWEMAQLMAADTSGMAGLVVLFLAPALLVPALVLAALLAWLAVSLDWDAISARVSPRNSTTGRE